MEKTTEIHKTLGQAIDELIQALEPLDESSRVTAIRAACEHLKIRLTGTHATDASAQPTPTMGEASVTEAGRVPDIKSLKEQRQPSSANEMAALVAYYLSELAPAQERRSEVTYQEMVKYFKPLYPLPKAPRQLLPNATNAGYFDSLGGGKYRLNPVGYNLVVHNLPRVGAESKTTKSRRVRRNAKPKVKRKQ
jgi:hypothetical protein